MRFLGARIALLLLAGILPGPLLARSLTFEQRVAAQEALARVYYAHQEGATKPFEVAQPRSLLERRVRTYLQQSAMLQDRWNTPVTGEMLTREVQRMARGSRMPERLRQLFDALSSDGFLVEECLARQVLVARLARNFFAFDERIHAAARGQAEALHRDLVQGTIDPREDRAGRGVVQIEAREFARRRTQFPARALEIGPVVEQREAFVVRVVLEEREGQMRGAVYSVPKPTWDAWWQDAAGAFDGLEIPAVADGSARLPDLLAGQASCPDDEAWDNGSLDDQPARCDHTAVWTGTEMIIWGGMDYNTGTRYDPATDSWTPTSVDGAPSGRSRHSAVWTGSAMIIWGGYNQFTSFQSTGGRYDPVSDTWTPTSTLGVPLKRMQHTAVWTGSEMIIWGGYSSGVLNSGGRYDPTTNSWKSTSTAFPVPSARYGHTAVWTGTRMIVWGGWDQFVAFSSGASYDPVSNSWSNLSLGGAPVARLWHSAVWTGSEMIVWGGMTAAGTCLAGGARYDPATHLWTLTPSTGAPQARAYPSAVWTGTKMVLWGGVTTGYVGLVTGASYDPVANAWTAISTIGAPEGRYLQTTVWTGSQMIPWGGSGEFGPLDTGGRYDPTTDSWTPTSISEAPQLRASFTAVWTGNEMIVWGGGGGGGSLNTGGRYDPATDAWAPTSTLQAPAARSDHTAIWTGSEMIIWGGTGAVEYIGTGGRYDPLADSWEPTSTFAAPTPRYWHTAVWTGSKMIVWGGNNLGPLVSGSRYDPVSNSWESVAVVGSPLPRFLHTAVWTGSRMIVWGGSVNPPGSFTQTGASYDPVANQWTPISTLNAPNARREHTAVWTGSKMIVWGGSDGTVLFGTGGRYDPGTNTWKPTSMTGAPQARFEHTAVWTGGLMIIWGGGLAVGGRYDPVADLWLPTQANGALPSSSGHGAVWTGNLMIVWGGFGENTGGRYFPGADADCDGHPDVADCSALDPQVFAAPGEVTALRFADRVTLEWDSAIPSSGTTTIHRVVVGSVEMLPVGSGSETCLATTAAAQWADFETPDPGHARWYLVRAQNGCANGTYGFASDGTENLTGACP